MSNKPFEKLDQMLGKSGNNADAAQTTAIKKQREELKKRFLEITKDNYDKIPLGWQFVSELPGIKSTSIIKAPSEGLCVYISYDREGGKEKGYTFSLFKDGTLSGNMPKGLQISKEQLYEEVLYNLEAAGINFWYDDREKILEKHDWPFLPEEEGAGKESEKYEDARRIEFLRKQPDALFGYHSKWNNYKGFVFKGANNSFIVLDNRDVGNALFTLDLKENIDPSLAERCKNKDQDAMRQFVEAYWKQHENKGKWQLKNTPGAERFIHAPIDNWISQVKTILNSKNPLPDDLRSVKLTEKRKLAR